MGSAAAYWALIEVPGHGQQWTFLEHLKDIGGYRDHTTIDSGRRGEHRPGLQAQSATGETLIGPAVAAQLREAASALCSDSARNWASESSVGW
jgi:hypothetical protein